MITVKVAKSFANKYQIPKNSTNEYKISWFIAKPTNAIKKKIEN